MRMILGFWLSLMAGAVLAGDFWHFDTDEVIVAGPDPIAICYYQPTCAGPSFCDNWSCDEVDGLGARNPIHYPLGHSSPVRVMGARWAYASEGKFFIPMSKD